MLLNSCTDTNIEKGTVSLSLGDYERAIVFFNRALDKNPSDAAAHLGMGKALFQKAKAMHDDSLSLFLSSMHIEAARTLKGDADINSLLSSILTEQARICLGKRDTVRGLECLTRAIDYDKTAPVPLNIAGIIYFRTGRTDKAALLFERAVEIDSTDISSLFNRGMIAWHRGELDIAHQHWMRALRKAPDDDEILYWFARAEKELRDREIR